MKVHSIKLLSYFLDKRFKIVLHTKDPCICKGALRGLQCRVSDFFNWYSILLIRLRWFRIFFPNHSIVIRSRASILPMISSDFLSQKRETGTKWGLSIYFIYFCPGMGKDPHYLYLQGWWLYNPAQQVIFSLSWTKTIVLRLKSHSCKNPPLWHMTDSWKTSGNIIFIDSRMGLADFGKTVENYSYVLRLEKNAILQ